VPAVPPARNCASIGFERFYALDRRTHGRAVTLEDASIVYGTERVCTYLTVQTAKELIGWVVDGELRHLPQEH